MSKSMSKSKSMSMSIRMWFLVFIGVIGANADVAYFITECHDLKECGKIHAMEMDEMIKKIGMHLNCITGKSLEYRIFQINSLKN